MKALLILAFYWLGKKDKDKLINFRSRNELILNWWPKPLHEHFPFKIVILIWYARNWEIEEDAPRVFGKVLVL